MIGIYPARGHSHSPSGGRFLCLFCSCSLLVTPAPAAPNELTTDSAPASHGPRLENLAGVFPADIVLELMNYVVLRRDDPVDQIADRHQSNNHTTVHDR